MRYLKIAAVLTAVLLGGAVWSMADAVSCTTTCFYNTCTTNCF